MSDLHIDKFLKKKVLESFLLLKSVLSIGARIDLIRDFTIIAQLCNSSHARYNADILKKRVSFPITLCKFYLTKMAITSAIDDTKEKFLDLVNNYILHDALGTVSNIFAKSKQKIKPSVKSSGSKG